MALAFVLVLVSHSQVPMGCSLKYFEYKIIKLDDKIVFCFDAS